jgi:hypothetical protein
VSITPRRDVRSATTPAEAEHESHVRRRAAELEDGEGERDDHHPVAEHGDALTEEQEPKVAPAEDTQVLSKLPTHRR